MKTTKEEVFKIYSSNPNQMVRNHCGEARPINGVVGSWVHLQQPEHNYSYTQHISDCQLILKRIGGMRMSHELWDEYEKTKRYEVGFESADVETEGWNA